MMQQQCNCKNQTVKYTETCLWRNIFRKCEIKMVKNQRLCCWHQTLFDQIGDIWGHLTKSANCCGRTDSKPKPTLLHSSSFIVWKSARQSVRWCWPQVARSHMIPQQDSTAAPLNHLTANWCNYSVSSWQTRRVGIKVKGLFWLVWGRRGLPLSGCLICWVSHEGRNSNFGWKSLFYTAIADFFFRPLGSSGNKLLTQHNLMFNV